jgi:hypothetical protein
MANVLSPWIVHNVFQFGDMSIATEGGISLYARAISYDRVAPAGDTADSRLARGVYDTADFTKPRGELQTTVGVYNALVGTGKDPSEASAAMGAIAKEAIFRKPIVYLENTWTILGLYRQLYDPKTFTADHFIDQIITARTYFRTLAPDASEIPGDSGLTRAPWQAAQTLTKILYLLTLGGALTVLLLLFAPSQSRIAAAVLMIVALLGFLGGSLTAVFSPRYDIMFAPIVWILGSAAAVLLLQLVAAVLRQFSSRIRALVSARPRVRIRSRLPNWSLRASLSARLSRLRAWGRVPFRRAGLGLVAAAFLAPFSATHIAGSITVGRAAAIALAALLAFDVLTARPRDLRFGTPALLATSAYLGLFFWILVNAGAWGCNCEGKVGGFAEFAFVGILGLATLSFGPSLRRPVMLALLAGVATAAVLAVLGVGALNSGTIDLTQTGGRLSGTYGNANELGFALAVGIPIATAFALTATGRLRFLFAGVFGVLAATLFFTFSRGGIIAATIGVVAVGLWAARGSRRRVALVLGGATAAALLAAAAYSGFERTREGVSFTSVPAAFRPLDQRDLSGWDARAIGPIPGGPSRLRNQARGLVVSGGRGSGASFGWGEASDGTYRLRFTARALGRERLPIAFGLGDAVRGGGPEGRGVIGPRPHTFELSWQPQRGAPHARLFVWRRAGVPGGFELRDVSVSAHLPGKAERVIPVPERLRGSLFEEMNPAAENEEDRYVNSRLDGAGLALDAFASNPLRGIGWGTFPAYADEHLDYGRLAAHDQYLSVAAELGLVGLLLLGLLGTAVVAGIRRSSPGTAEMAAIGAFVAAAAGLVFVEALPVPQLSIPLALTVAVLCARRREPQS